jgi:hypothetical protein
MVVPIASIGRAGVHASSRFRDGETTLLFTAVTLLRLNVLARAEPSGA